MKVIGVTTGEGRVEIMEDIAARVFFVADADIDADGANGQAGAQAAYMVGDKGSEYLANGGMKMQGGKVVGAADWFRDIVILDSKGRPREFRGGVIASKTAYSYPGIALDDPAAYVDAETVPYIVVPPIIIQKTKGVVMGCRARATNTVNGKSCEGIVADVGPRTKSGELSMAMARSIGLPHSPRNGGTERAIILYELWPGIHGTVNGAKIALRSSSGKYIPA